ncbi:MAG: hypothetical protein AAFP02_18575, partial [Bacteroidota bacterium]
MNKLPLFLLSLMAFGLVACSGPRYASTTEYDDVYYSSSDQTEPVATARVEEAYESQERYREPVDSYNDTYYAEDDFYYSRRLRRFNSTASNYGNWRYYDPYFSNDLYFVMGTNSWNAWNNAGWYSWNQPRFGRAWNNPYYGGFDPFFGSGFNNFNTFGAWTGYGYYDPFISTYYGYSPFYGNSFFGNNFYNPYAFGGGFGNPAFAG